MISTNFHILITCLLAGSLTIPSSWAAQESTEIDIILCGPNLEPSEVEVSNSRMQAVMRLMYGEPPKSISDAVESAGDRIEATGCVSTDSKEQAQCANQSIPPNPWSGNVKPAIERFVNASQHGLRIKHEKRSVCSELSGQAWRKRTCFAEKGAVYCDILALSRVLQATAWQSTASAVFYLATSKDGRKRGVSILSSLQLVEASEIDSQNAWFEALKVLISGSNANILDIANIIDTMEELRISDNSNANIVSRGDFSPRTLESELAYDLYRPSANYVLAFLLGHELAHARAECSSNKPSWAETSGMLSFLFNAHVSGEVLCPMELLLEEAQADRCALREVEGMDISMRKRVSEHDDARIRGVLERVLTMSRDTAISVNEGLINFGLGTTASYAFASETMASNDIPTFTVVVPRRTPGYLYSSLRILLFSRLMRELDDGPNQSVRLCGDSAQRTMNSLSLDSAHWCNKKHPSQRLIELIEPFDGLMPDRTIKAERTGQWEWPIFSNYSCEPE